ncbi:MAG TPA: PIN domain-containing protein [Clostridiales bacterium]|nr:PIN domain-containing protein [Clostridiales bacterium]
MKIYLDNCCFNRPYDDQTQLKIYLETQAKLDIQKDIISGEYELVWSFILDFENEQNPFELRKNSIAGWRSVAKSYIILNDNISNFAKLLLEKGLKKKDALHIACAVEAKCNVFLTTDKKLLNTLIPEIQVLSPLEFISKMEG